MYSVVMSHAKDDALWYFPIFFRFINTNRIDCGRIKKKKGETVFTTLQI